MLKNYLKENNISVYAVSRDSGIPYTTLNELVNGKKDIEECSLKTIEKISGFFNVSVDTMLNIIKPPMNKKEIHLTWENQRNVCYSFPIVAGSDYYDAYRIYPLKQKLAKKVFENFKNDERVKKIVLFGSSTTMRCTRNSDTDFAIELSKEYMNKKTKDEISEIIQEICDWKADIIWMDKINKGTKIYQNIKKGVNLK